MSLDKFIVRLRKRKPHETIGRDGSPFVLEVGFEGRAAVREFGKGQTVKEKGRMVAVTLSREDQIVDALHVVADLYEKQRKRDTETSGRILVPTFNGGHA